MLSSRRFFQTIVLLLTLGIGLQFFVYVNQAERNGSVVIARPPGVEGFLPIGALMGWKHFFMTGQWDPVHPAAMVILAFAALISFLFRKSFCSWFCPVGTLSECFWKLGRLLFGRNYRVPKYADGGLRLIKYALLGFFACAIATMGGNQIEEFLHSPYYQMADAKMLFFFTRMTRLAFVVLLFLMALSLLFKNFWCRYACPYGALMGLFGFFSPTRIHRHETKCTGCRRCDQSCPSLLVISGQTDIRGMECTGCMDCVISCPSEGALGLETNGLNDFRWGIPELGITILLLYAGIVFLAGSTGHWQGNLSDRDFAAQLRTIHSPEIRHPEFRPQRDSMR